MDASNNFVFKDQRDESLPPAVPDSAPKLQYDFVQLTIEAQTRASPAPRVDDRAGKPRMCVSTNSTTSINCDARDTAAAQTTLSVCPPAPSTI